MPRCKRDNPSDYDDDPDSPCAQCNNVDSGLCEQPLQLAEDDDDGFNVPPTAPKGPTIGAGSREQETEEESNIDQSEDA